LRKNPEEVLRHVVRASALTFGVPIASLQWLASRLPQARAVSEIAVESAPPGLRFRCVATVMATSVRVSAVVSIRDVAVSPDALRVTFRLSDVTLEIVGAAAGSPVAALIQSGVLDLSKPGKIANFIPNRPAFIVEADDDRIVVDIMQVPKVAANSRARTLLSLLAPVVGVRSVESDSAYVWVAFRARLAGLKEVAARLRAHA